MEVKKLYSNRISQMKFQEKYHEYFNRKQFSTTFGDKCNYYLYASQDLHIKINHAPRQLRRPRTITIFKNGKHRKYIYFKGFSSFIKKCILSNDISNNSLPNLTKAYNKYSLSSKSKSSEEISSIKFSPFKMNFIVNTVTETERFYHSANAFGKPCWKIYRCQFNAQEESCCCSCNSDAMFEVMKSLYDCYKKKNCDHCNCILCGHLPREERRMGEIRKSVSEIKAISEGKPKKVKKMKGKKIKDVSSLLKDKSPEEKEKVLRDLVNSGAILPEGKTKSEKELIKKVQAERMIPEERKVSEKVSEERLKSKSLKLRKAKEEGLLTPLEGKTPKQKEKILKGLAMNGIPLPTDTTPSTKKIVDKVRKEVGLPPEPVTAEDKQNYNNAMESGLITPLEGKSPSEKERILKGLAATGIPLPEARTASEKALIAKIKELPPSELAVVKPEKRKAISRALAEAKTLSDKLRKAKTEGLLTPLEGKTEEQKRKILKELVKNHIPLPEGKTNSEKKLIDEVHKEMGLPPQPKTPSAKVKYQEAVKAGLVTPLQGKSPKQKEKILKGLAMNGIPLPLDTTPSTKKIVDKVRKEVGLPPEPVTAADKQNYNNAIQSGLITPLEGKSPSEKERILIGLAATGVPLPEARTASEKALIAKVKELPPSELVVVKPEKRKVKSRALAEAKTLSEKLRKAKAEGLLTPLEGKTEEQKRKILKELVKNHIPLPEGKTNSEKKIIEQVHEEMGLPPQPKTPSAKEKYQEAVKAGLVTPLEGKTASEKEQILTGLNALGVDLPVGRTPSEKALIAKVKESPPIPGEIAYKPERKITRPGVLPSLRGKTPEEKEQVLKKIAMNNMPLPEGKTPSEKLLINKVRADVGLPPEPKSKSEKETYKQAEAAGLIVPLEGKTQSEKEKILQGQADLGLELPQGRTASEKSLINKIKKGKKKKVKTRDKGVSPPALPPEKRKKLDTKTLKVMKEGKGPSDECICGLLTPESERFSTEVPPSFKVPSEKLKAPKTAGLLTPLEGKTPAQKEKILKNMAKTGIPLPEPKTASEKKIMEKVQNELGLPPAPLTPSLKEKYAKAQAAGIITPLEGKSPSQKEKILKKQAEMGLNLPVGRTPSEKALIDKVRTGVKPAEVPSDKIRKYSLEGKTPEEKEKILRNIAKAGLPLPEGKTPSEKAIIKKVKETTPVSAPTSERIRKAKAAGLLTPLEGKTPSQKEDIIKRHLAAGIPLPEPKSASEKKIIKDVLAKSSKILHGKTLSQKEKILKSIAKQGLPLPEPKTTSDKAIIDKIRAETTPSLKVKQARAAGLMTPLQGKTNEEKEKILKGLAKIGIPLPEATSPSEKKIVEKVRHDLGLPPEPKTLSIKEKMLQAQAAGIITPLEGKTPAQKEKVLKKMHEAGIPLPKGRTKSEKSMIKKIKATEKGEIVSEKLKEAKVKGLTTPLEGKTPEQKEKILRKLAKSDMPLPEGKTPSEKALIAKIKAEEGLPPPKLPPPKLPPPKLPPPKLPPPELPEKIKKLDKKTAKVMKEGKGPSDECICGLLTPPEIEKVSVKKPIHKIPSEKMHKAKAAGLLTPLEGKTPEQKEKILKGLAMQEIPLPEPRTTSERKLHDKVRADLGMVPQPKTPSAKIKYNEAVAAGLIVPLEGKSPSQKEKILKGQAALGLPLPEGRTPSEKALIAKVRASAPKPVGEVLPVQKIPSEKLRKAKAAGLLTPLEGKTPEQKEKILKGLAMQEIPLPEPKTASERKLHDKVRADLGMVPQPKTPSAKIKYNEAVAAGLIVPLEGKSPSQKEKILKGQAALGLPLPEGRTPSEKALIAKVKASAPKPVGELVPVQRIPSEKMRKAKAAGVLTPLEGKTPEQKEKILKGLAMQEIPLPEPRTASEKKLHDKVRADLGMVPQPKTPSAKIKYNEAVAAGLIVPLEGKSPSQKEKILKGQAALGLPLPEGRTPSEKALIAKVKASAPKPAGELVPVQRIPSEKMRKAKAAGLLTPLEGKTPEQKEKILKGLAMQEIPLPEPRTTSERKLHDKVRADLGMVPQPKTPSAKIKYNEAVAAGLIVPLEGKSPSQKEKILKGQAALGLPLPEGRTPSEKALIAKVRASAPKPVGEVLPVQKIPSEKLRKAKAAGLLTPLEGKTPEQKEKILKGLAMQDIPLPEPRTASERKLHDKVRADLGMVPHPKTPSAKIKYNEAVAAGLIVPLEGKSPSQKEKILKGQAALGLPLPEGRTPSEKALIAKVRASAPKHVGEVLPVQKIPSEKLRKAKAAGLLTPLEGKTPEQKEKILKGLAMQEIPLPEPRTASEKKLHDKVRAELGMVPQPKTPSAKIKYNDAVAAGLIAPLEGKSPSQKEKILKGQAALGLPLPEGRTPSEKALIAKVKASAPKPEEKKLPMAIPSEKLHKAKAAGLLTPLEGKTPEQKEKILKQLALQGIPLPEPKTASESKIIDKVVASLGLPPQPKTSSEKLKYKNAIAAGLITPLQGKTKPQKEKILRGQAELGLPLPEGRTASEKALIAKIKTTPVTELRKSVEKISRPTLPPEKLAKLDKKTAKVMKESKKPSDECICDLLTPESEKGLKEAAPIVKIPSKKLHKAKAAGLLTPLKGKTTKEKEKILKELALQGIPLPEAQSASEKKLIAKVRNDVGLPPEPKTLSMKEKYDKAIADDIIVPLEGKTNAEKEKILRKQAELGLPLPVGRTPSEKALIAKVEKGAPPPEKILKAKAAPASEKIRKAKAAGLLTPLKGKTAKEKEKILKDLALQGIPLPEAQSASEKKLIAKVRNDVGLPPEPKTLSMKEKYDKAVADDIIVPLEGKTNAEKEKILRKQAVLGLPLPVGRTPSEKALIAKIEKEVPAPEKILKEKGITASEKIRKAKAAGLLTPLEGKTPQEKQKILQGLADAGLPLPKGKTPSEVSLIQKIKPKPEVAPKLIATEKEKIKTKSRKVGVPKSKGGITEEYQDIVKTTTCDKGCGCDKKKIRFKHSYVKIRVTSPDISSLCPCPEECLPGVKGGVFTDNEGIKVTVGRVTCIPSNNSRKLFEMENYNGKYKNCSTLMHNPKFKKSIDTKNKHQLMYESKSESDIYLIRRSFLYDSDDNLNRKKSLVDSYSCTYCSTSSASLQNELTTDISSDSFNSVNFLKTKSSLSLTTLPSTVSVWSFSATSNSISSCSDNEGISCKEDILYETIQNVLLPGKNKGNITNYTSLNSSKYPYQNNGSLIEFETQEIQVYRADDVNNDFIDNRSPSMHIIYVDEIDDSREVEKVFKKTMSETSNLYKSSSLIIIVSSSSENSSDNSYNSTIYLDLSETHSVWNHGTSDLHHLRGRQKGFKICTRGNIRDFDNNGTQSSQPREVGEHLLNTKKHEQMISRNNCQRIVGTDTTEDRPCCCEVKNVDMGTERQDARVERSDRIVSEFLKPMILKDVVNQGFSHEFYMLDLPDSSKSSYSLPHHSRCEPTPVRLCKLPPCSGHKLCHDNIQSKKRPYALSSDTPSATPSSYKSCDCSTAKLKKLLEENAKQLISIACGDSKEDLQKGCNKIERKRVQIPYEITSATKKCSSCTSSKSNLQPISTRDRNKKHTCPCVEHQKMSNADSYSREFDSGRKNNCQCPNRPQKKKNKNFVCECPEEPELEFDISDWFDEKQLRKMQSDLTQTTSGFKIKIPRKKSDSEIAFEEALKYYAETLENIDNDKCGCKDKSKKKSNATCECPYVPPAPPVPDTETPNEPFTGIKFRIDGKGTASKGLSGILCFE